MALKCTEVEYLTNIIVGNLGFKLDYYKKGIKKLLIVEGATDEFFLNHFKGCNVDCIVAKKAFISNNMLRTMPVKNVNCKNAIINIITGVSYYPSPFIKYKSDFDKCDVYGMVDADYENYEFSRQLQRLFVTDTHDLETLLLWTDQELLLRLKECEIKREEIFDAYYIAYQLSVIRHELFSWRETLCLEYISCGASQVDFSCFLSGKEISIPKLVEYINSKSIVKINTSKYKCIVKHVCNSKILKKKINEEGVWSQSVSEFFQNFPNDFWSIVNGHDILQILRYLNESANMSFGKTGEKSLQRSFEMKLIEVYDYKLLNQTEIYKKMMNAGIVKGE